MFEILERVLAVLHFSPREGSFMKSRVRHRLKSCSNLRPGVESLESRLCLSTFTVTNVNDAGPGSFRQALLDAVAAPTADQIVFDSANVFSTPQIISLQSGLPFLSGGNLDIIGPGSANLTIRRDPAAATNFRILTTLIPLLHLSGVTLSGGNPTGYGGGLFIDTEVEAILDDVALTGNSVVGSGGAIMVDYLGSLTLRNSIITGNTSTAGGGGIYFYDGGALQVENTTISGNTSGGGGGGLYFFSGASLTPPAGYTPHTVVFRNSTVNNNVAHDRGGGGIYLPNFYGVLQVQNSTLNGNVAEAYGGAICGSPRAGFFPFVPQNTTTPFPPPLPPPQSTARGRPRRRPPRLSPHRPARPRSKLRPGGRYRRCRAPTPPIPDRQRHHDQHLFPRRHQLYLHHHLCRCRREQ